MFADPALNLSRPIVQAIEDAVLLGNIREIDGVLELVKDDEDFSDTLRYGLEALRNFRLYYGKGGELEPKNDADKNKVLRLESIWGR